MTKILQLLLTELWITEEVASIWKEALKQREFGKSDLNKRFYWKCITLPKTTNKIVYSILHLGISTALNQVLKEEHAGLRTERSCIDHINTLRIIREQSVEF